MRRFLFVSLLTALPAFAVACSSRSDDVGRLRSDHPDGGQAHGTGAQGTGGVVFGSGGQAADARVADGQASIGRASGGTSAVDSRPAPECKAMVESMLPGITIEFAASTKCVYTLAEVKAGITIDYELAIEHDVPDYVPQTYPYMEDVLAGLFMRETVFGGSQSYCLCDRGLPHALCPEMDGGLDYYPPPMCAPITLKAGRYARSFTWHGENWNGQSDTGNPKGPQFPPGDYQLVVKTLPGWLGVPEAGTPATMVQVGVTLPIRLTR